MAIYTNTIGFTTAQAGNVMSALFFANMCSQIPLGWLSDRLGVRKVMTCGLCVFVAALVMLIIPGMTLNRMYAVGAIVGFTVVLMSVMVAIVVGQVFGQKDFASILGFIIGIRTIGIAIGAPIINAFYDVTGSYQLAFIIYLVGMVVCIGCAFVGTKKLPFDKLSTHSQA
jgi:MFS family permease